MRAAINLNLYMSIFKRFCSQNLTPDNCLAFLVDISITNIDS